MKIDKNIKKIFILLFWLLASSSILVLLVAAINVKNKKTCSGVRIEISGVEEIFFLDKQDVLNIITRRGVDKPKGQPVNNFDLNTLEERLRRNVWVKDAELFFDNNMVLHVHIAEREPV